MNKKIKTIRKITLVGILLILILSGCRKKPQKISDNINKSKVSKKLQEILMSTDELKKTIDKIEEELEKDPKEEAEKEKKEIIKKLEQQKEEKGGEGGEGKQGNEVEDVKTQKEKVAEMWKKLEGNVENIHKQWNDYKVEALKDKADTNQIKDFEEKLNNLTIAINKESYIDTLSNANNLYSSIAYFTSIYETYDSEVIKLKYDINKVYIDGKKGTWVTAGKSMKIADDQYKKVSKELNKKLKEDSDKKDKGKKNEGLEKLKLSIDSMGNTLDKKDIKLLKIKRDIVNDNIEQVKKY